MSNVPSYEFGVSEFTTKPWSFEQDVTNYARLGVQDIQVAEVKLDPNRIQEQLATIPQHHMKIGSVQPTIRTLFPSLSQPEPKNVPDRMARFRQTIKEFGRYARGVAFVTNTGIPPNGNIQEVINTANREYRALADFAAEYGATVALEPLNPSIMNVESSIWLISQAMRIIEAVDRPNFGLCLDYWNSWQNPHVEEAIKQAGDRIFDVHVSDYRTPRSYEDRYVPGTGDIPLPALLHATYEAGYRGPYEVEIFSGLVPHSLWEGDLTQLIKDSRAGLNNAWEEAFAGTAVAAGGRS